MVKRNRPDGIVKVKVVFVWRVVSPPSHHVVRTELSLTFIDLSDVFVQNSPLLFFVLVPGSWELKISRVSKPVGPNRTEFGKSEVMSEYFSHPALDLPLNINGEFNTPRDDKYFFGTNSQPTVESPDVECSGMRHNQEITVRIVKRGLSHGSIGTVGVDGYALLESGLTSSHQRNQALNKGLLPLSHRRDRFPPKLVWVVIQVFLLEITGDDLVGILRLLVLSFDGRGPDLVVPNLLVIPSLHCECSARQLLSIESVFELDGAVLSWISSGLPAGRAPGRASVAKEFPSPFWQVSPAKRSDVLSIYIIGWVSQSHQQLLQYLKFGMEEAKGLIRTIATAEDPSLVRCFRGHEKAVASVGFSKEMKQIVSGGADGLVEVWNFKPQIRPFKFVGHKGQVNDVLFNADSSKVISCGDDREIRIWKNSVNGKHKAVKAHSGPVLKLSLSQQEDFLMSCSSDKTIKMWDLDGKFKQSFVGHTNWVRECQISFDERLLLSCSDDRSVKLWDITKATVSATFTEHKSEVLSCKFTPDGTCIAASAVDGTIKVWDTRLGKLIQHYNAHDRAVNRIAFHPLGYHMASVSSDNKIKIWELKQGRLGWTVFGHEGEIRTIDFNEKGDYFATGGDDKLVMIWMTNFDRDLNNAGRGVENNFREKANGDGLQPLFKSNKLALDNPPANEQPEPPRTKPTQRSQKADKIAELMSFELEKIVNQLEVITRSLDFIDRNVSEHEGTIEKLLNSEQVDNIINEMEERNLMDSQVYNSAWEAQKRMEGEEPPSPSQQAESLGEEDGEYSRFLAEEQAKRVQFQKQLQEEEEGEVDFRIGELQLQEEF